MAAETGRVEPEETAITMKQPINRFRGNKHLTPEQKIVGNDISYWVCAEASYGGPGVGHIYI
jgi:hypothetical protein